MNEDKPLLNSRIVLAGSLLFLFIYFLPFIILGERAYFTIGDCLDSSFEWQRLLALTGETFDFNANHPIYNVMNGIPRGVFGNGIHIVSIAFYLFKPATAYILIFIVTHLIGFFSMNLLLQKYILKEKNQRQVAIACSLIFAIVPFYSIYGASVSYQPLMLFAFLNLLEDKKAHWTNSLIICLFPFCCYTVLVGVFAFGFLVVFIAVKMMLDKRIYKRYIAGLCLMIAVSFLYDLPLLYQNFFNHGFISSRAELNLASTIASPFWYITVNFITYLFETQYHSGEFYTFPIIVAVLAGASIAISRKNYKNAIFFLVISIILISFIHSIGFLISDKLGKSIAVFKSFQFDRFYFLLPTIWIVLFALSIKEMFLSNGLKIFIWSLVLIQLAIVLCCNTEYKNNIKILAHRKTTEPNCQSYYATNLFKQISGYINKPLKDYRVVSLGMHPNIAQYNGFYTLDAYQPVYDLRYKHLFRKVIAGELNKSTYIKNYFDDWGSRCYMFTAELGTNYLFGKDSAKQINNPAFDYGVLKGMGCKYIISAVKINNFNPQVLSLEKEFEDPNSFWGIYLYKIL